MSQVLVHASMPTRGYSTTSPDDQALFLDATSQFVESREAQIVMASHNEDFIESQDGQSGRVLYHFKVRIQGEEIEFLYEREDGPDDSRALDVARALGFREGIIERAQRFIDDKEQPVTKVAEVKPPPVLSYSAEERGQLMQGQQSFQSFLPHDDMLRVAESDRPPAFAVQGELEWRYGRRDAHEPPSHFGEEKPVEVYEHDPTFGLFSHDSDFGGFKPFAKTEFGELKNDEILVLVKRMLMTGSSTDSQDILERQKMFAQLIEREQNFEFLETSNQIFGFMRSLADHFDADFREGCQFEVTEERS